MTPRGDFYRHETKKPKKAAKKVATLPTEFVPPPEVAVVPKGKKARPPEEEEEA